VEEAGGFLAGASADDRLAGSTPFLTMLSVAVAGWLMERQGRIAAGAEGDTGFLARKRAAARFFVGQLVPEAMGLKAAAVAGAGVLYALGDGDFG